MATDRLVICYFWVLIFFIPLSTLGKSTPITLTEISKVRLLTHNNLPIKLLVYLENRGNYYQEDSQFRNSNQKFVNELAKIVLDINLVEKKLQRDALKLVILDSTEDPKLNFLELTEDQKNLFITRFPFVGDVWLQDFGEIMMARTINDSKDQLLLLDLNRGRGLKDLAKNLSYFWNSYYFKSHIRSSAGNYGGNLEVTPNQIVYMGTTAQQELADFFVNHGYQHNFLRLNTDWLHVGHVDEFVSTIMIPEDPCGFGIVKASPMKALEILKNSNDQDFSTIPLEYSTLYNYSEELLTVRNFLKNSALTQSGDFDPQEFVASQQVAEKIINENVNKLILAIKQKTTSCQKIKIIDYPNLYKCEMLSGNQIESCLAYLPGPINMIVLKNHLVIPDPLFAPFRQFLQEELTAKQQIPHFIDSMFYHVILGGIHCGTNVFRLPNEYFLTRVID